MSLVYYQKTGILLLNGTLLDKGYSGFGANKNNDKAQDERNSGPIPRGLYFLDNAPFDSKEHGPFCLRLTPSSYNEMFLREGFLIHGDSIDHPGEASRGCIILARVTREKITTEPNLTVV